MDEKRKFFRLKNHGEILAKSSEQSLEVVEISSSGALVIKKNINLSQTGTIEIIINNFDMLIHYQILRTDEETMVLIFKKEFEINKLFRALKNLRDEQRKLN
ncbi:hypothetical protein [Legionella shakespearei]|uniref:PilZ domain-containing protein n=1 Tax=Legionella shakespearei DSM 23087 TaxID=1122169 RepID=A0A0W0YW14_9GAMM|nr:hypothetical protein [Legionella shakespearei]KTD61063.1 hypothetical protein Lsha_1310 [Legionella shakespearei DSM 23087]